MAFHVSTDGALWEYIQEQFTRKEFCDIIVVASSPEHGEVQHFAHKIILGFLWPNFYKFCNTPKTKESFSDSDSGDVEVVESNIGIIQCRIKCSPKSCKKFINYLYNNGKIDFSDVKEDFDTLFDLYNAARVCKPKGLEQIIEDFLKKKCAVENVCKMLQYCENYGMTEFSQFCLEFIDLHARFVLDLSQKYFLELTPEVFEKIIIRQTTLDAEEIQIFRAVYAYICETKDNKHLAAHIRLNGIPMAELMFEIFDAELFGDKLYDYNHINAALRLQWKDTNPDPRVSTKKFLELHKINLKIKNKLVTEEAKEFEKLNSDNEINLKIDDNTHVVADNIKELEKLASEYCRNTEKANIFRIYEALKVFSLQEAMNEVLQFISKNTYDCIQQDEFLDAKKETIIDIAKMDYLTSNEEELFEAIFKWIQHQHRENLSDAIIKMEFKDILPHIRFPIMEHKYLHREIAPKSFIFSSAKDWSNILFDADIFARNQCLEKRSIYSSQIRGGDIFTFEDENGCRTFSHIFDKKISEAINEAIADIGGDTFRELKKDLTIVFHRIEAKIANVEFYLIRENKKLRAARYNAEKDPNFFEKLDSEVIGPLFFSNSADVGMESYNIKNGAVSMGPYIIYDI